MKMNGPALTASTWPVSLPKPAASTAPEGLTAAGPTSIALLKARLITALNPPQDLTLS